MINKHSVKIFTPISPRNTGGSSTFAKKFKKGMEKRGHIVMFDNTDDYDVLLVIASCPAKHLIDAKLRRKKIIHRLDGIYYPMSVAGKHWRRANLPLQIIHHFFADFTVFQSEFSRLSVNRFLGENRYTPSRIIYNGVDTNLFSPSGTRVLLHDNDNQHICIVTGRFRRTDQLQPILEAFEIYRTKHHRNTKLYVIGDITKTAGGATGQATYVNSPLETRTDNPQHVIFTDPISNHELSAYLRAADIFLFTHLNPPCPNNILEAMACALPICGVDDGAMREITKTGANSELIPSTPDNFFKPRTLDLHAFASNMHKIMKNQKTYADSSRNFVTHHFSLEHMIDAYEEVVRSIL